MEIQTEKCTLKELFPQTSVSSVIDLCGESCGNLIPWPSSPRSYCFRVWMFPASLHRHLRRAWPLGMLPCSSARQFPEVSFSGIATLHWLWRGGIQMEESPSGRNQDHWYSGKDIGPLRLSCSCFVKPWRVINGQVCTMGTPRGPHCVGSPKFAFIVNQRQYMRAYYVESTGLCKVYSLFYWTYL